MKHIEKIEKIVVETAGLIARGYIDLGKQTVEEYLSTLRDELLRCNAVEVQQMYATCCCEK